MTIKYTAASIIIAISGNKDIKAKGLDGVVCPLRVACRRDIENCAKGQKGKCPAPQVNLEYLYWDHTRYRDGSTSLVFWFYLKDRPSEGFIEEDDFSLNTLFRRGIIDKVALDIVVEP